MAGCPGTSLDLLNHMPINRLEEIYESAVFSASSYSATPGSGQYLHTLDQVDTLRENGSATVTPLQMAWQPPRFCAGTRPATRIALAVNTTSQDGLFYCRAKGSGIFT